MKIAIFHELPFGGARDGVYYFGEGLSKNRITVDLYYVSNEEEKREASFFRNIYFYNFVPRKWTGNNWKARLYNDTIALLKLNNLHKEIAQKIDENDYDLVLVNGSQYIEAPFILKYLSTFKVFYCHDPNYRIIYEKILFLNNNKLNLFKRKYENFNRLIRKFIDKINFNNADLILANSIYAKKTIKKTYGKNSQVVYPGVDINFFSPKACRKDIDIFYIGSYEKIDGFDLLRKSLIDLPGKIVLKTKMNEDGWISDRAIIRDYYRRSRIVVCLAFNEPFGSVPIEAMSCSVPVIAVNSGGYLETVVNNKTGYLINRNSSELADKIIGLLNDKNKLKKMGEAGRKEAVNKWSWNLRSKELSEVLHKAIKNK